MILTILNPERTLLHQEGVTAVELPGTVGRFVVLPGHAPLISSLTDGTVRYDLGEERHTLPVKGGFVEIKNDEVTVCAD